ncbi:UNVERIFIED_CONTAM: hypothetical protein GTU68_025794 [Idotea baltica]|nr:hypothetical protein [Idotea baltica]
MLEENIWQIEEHTDIIILPEMFNTGFSMEAKNLSEPVNYKTFRWMNQMAKQKDAAVVGSYIVKESNKFYNRLYWVAPDGSFSYYDKSHLFRMSDEHQTFTQGKKRMICNFRGWKIMPLICYDLRFPLWSRNRYDKATDTFDYDLLIYVANWPKPRTEVWDTLLNARSLENQCYTIGVNRIGSDGVGIDYDGNSAVYDYKGQALNDLLPTNLLSKLHRFETSKNLQAFERNFLFILDWDGFRSFL